MRLLRASTKIGEPTLSDINTKATKLTEAIASALTSGFVPE